DRVEGGLTPGAFHLRECVARHAREHTGTLARAREQIVLRHELVDQTESLGFFGSEQRAAEAYRSEGARWDHQPDRLEHDRGQTDAELHFVEADLRGTMGSDPYVALTCEHAAARDRMSVDGRDRG